MGDAADRIRARAEGIGLDAVAFAPAAPARHAEAFRGWLEAGMHADMGWLARDPDRRIDPRRVLPGARTLVLAAVSYQVQEPDPAVWNDPTRGRIARYAWGPDYHEVVLPMLEELAAAIRAESGEGTITRCYVDTGPVLERDHAARAGLGFIGRHTLLIRPDLGSLVFLGVILTTADLSPDPPAADDGASLAVGGKVSSCGGCRRCLDVCPTRSFPASHVLDARRCISYLTIEHRGAIPEDLRPRMGRWIFGCDECQTVCPWNRKFAKPGRKRWLAWDPDRCAPRLEEILVLDEAGFRARFAGTAVLRARRTGLLRNALIAAGNSGSPSLIPALEKLSRDADPMLQRHAAWSLSRLHETQ
jgi:epoxyqueuosine reductase